MILAMQYSHVTDYIKSLPDEPCLEVFGLHENTLIGWCTSVSRSFWKYLMQLQPEVAEMDADNNEEEKSAPDTPEMEKKAEQRPSVTSSSAPKPSVIIAKPEKMILTGAESAVAGIIEGILQKLPALYDMQTIKKAYGLEDILPTNVVLLQELDR